MLIYGAIKPIMNKMLKGANYPYNACCQQKSNTYSRELVASIPMFA